MSTFQWKDSNRSANDKYITLYQSEVQSYSSDIQNYPNGDRFIVKI